MPRKLWLRRSASWSTISSRVCRSASSKWSPSASRLEDAALIEALLDHAFGPGRFVKSSERVREFAAFYGVKTQALARQLYLELGL